MTPAKGYTEMKDSGIPSIGDIPSAWNITRIHNLFFEVSKKYSETNDDFLPLLSVSEYYGVAERAEKIDSDSILIRAETLDGYKKCKEGDIVSNIMLTWKGALGRSPKCGIVSPAYCVYRPRPGVNSRFYHYLFRTISYQDIFRINSTGLIDSRLRLYSPKFFVIQTIVPPKEEQEKIVSYLDTQCAKIDEIIAQAKASIEDYKQWKASIIYEAVTKGLDPNVEMKESGVPWIGKMPINWTISALKNLCTMQAGKNLTSEQISTSGQYPVYGGNGQRGYYSAYNADGHFLLIGRQGALCGNVHDVTGKFWATEHAVVTSATKVTNVCYLYYLLIAMNLNQYASNSAAQPGLSVGNILNLKALLPPINEQARISKFLDDFCSKIDVILTEKQSLIGDLESYKKSLIYEVVTGKRRVCK